MEASDEPGERSPALVSRFRGFELPRIGASVAAEPSQGTAAERGSWTHLVLQHLDLLQTLDYAGISAQIDGLIDRGLLTEDQRAAVDLEALAAFFGSPLGRRLTGVPPDRVWREAPFVVGLSPQEVGGIDVPDDLSDERVVVRGIIDCVFEEKDGLVLVDYKTDGIGPEEVAERVALYEPQMRLYARAVATIFPAPLKEAYLYFLALDHAVKAPLQAIDAP